MLSRGEAGRPPDCLHGYICHGRLLFIFIFISIKIGLLRGLLLSILNLGARGLSVRLLVSGSLHSGPLTPSSGNAYFQR